ESVDFADNPVAVRHVDDDEIFLGRRPQGNRVRRKRLLHPVPAVLDAMQRFFLDQKFQHVLQRLPAKVLSLLKRKLIRSAFDMIDQDNQIVGVNARLLRRMLEKKLRIFDNVLIERIAARYKEGDGAFRPPPGAARLLPRTGDAAGIAVQHARLQLADIDAELERVRAYNAANVAAAQTAFNFAAKLGQVAAAVAANPFLADF